MLWLAILFPQFALQVLARTCPDARPLAVSTHSPQTHVLAANATACAAGVYPGQPVASALSILPALHLQARDTALETATLTELADWASQFTPRLSVAPPDAILLEISSSLRLFGGAETIETAVQQGLSALGFQARTAFAPTALGARWLAGYGHCSANTQNWPAVLQALPLACLGDEGACSTATLELLAGLGLQTLGEVSALPAAGLAQRQAEAVAMTLDRALGQRPDPRPWHHPAESFNQIIALAAPTHHIDPLLFASRRLCASLANWLTLRHAAVDHYQLMLIHERLPATAVELTSTAPISDEARLHLLVRERLSALTLKADVTQLRLHARHPVSANPAATDLFDDPRRGQEGMLMLIDRLRARLGTHAIRKLAVRADHRPEAACAVAQVASDPQRQTRSHKETAAAASQAGKLRPLWLLPKPRRIETARLRVLSEAERIESGWWDEADVRRDYYLASDTDDRLCWVFRDLNEPACWYVHGYFG